jgi:hypothetical protein
MKVECNLYWCVFNEKSECVRKEITIEDVECNNYKKDEDKFQYAKDNNLGTVWNWE